MLSVNDKERKNLKAVPTERNVRGADVQLIVHDSNTNRVHYRNMHPETCKVARRLHVGTFDAMCVASYMDVDHRIIYLFCDVDVG